MLLDLNHAREALETDAPVGLLKLLLEETEALITERAGPLATATIRREGMARHFFLGGRVASTVDAVVEEDAYTPVSLDSSDYALRYGGRALERLPSGTHGRYEWGEWVEVTFTPADDSAKRKRVQLDLLRLELTYRGLLKSTTDGEFSSAGVSTPEAYRDERAAVLATLLPPLGVAV
jgi:hypothetical protein